jgi:thioredoxin 1
MANNDLIKHLTDDNFHSEVLKGVILVDFFATWCGPCRMLTPIIEDVAKFFVGKAKVGKVDIDSEQKTAAEFQVTSVPTLVLFKDGKEIGRLIGLRDMEAIKDFVSSVL